MVFVGPEWREVDFDTKKKNNPRKPKNQKTKNKEANNQTKKCVKGVWAVLRRMAHRKVEGSLLCPLNVCQ